MATKSTYDISHLKIALVYDWATTRYGGAEVVLKTLLESFPAAPLFTTIAIDKLPWVDSKRIQTTWLQKFPTKNHRLLAPLMPLAIETLDFSGFDIIISISTGMCLGVLTKPNQFHICYLLSPPRYIYDYDQAYGQSVSLLNRWPIIIGNNQARRYLRWWQNQACLRPDVIIPLSNRVKRQAEQWYQKPIAEPVYPPIANQVIVKSTGSIDNLNKSVDNSPTPFWLMVARLVPYKRVDLAIQTALQAKIRLLIVGSGPDNARLLKIAGDQAIKLDTQNKLNIWLQSQSNSTSSTPRIGFCLSIDQQHLNQLYQSATVAISPGIDDFGLAPLEAVIHGTPAVRHANSGVGELLISGKDGCSISHQSLESLRAAIESTKTLRITPQRRSQLKQKLSQINFIQDLTTHIQQNWYTLKQ